MTAKDIIERLMSSRDASVTISGKQITMKKLLSKSKKIDAEKFKNVIEKYRKNHNGSLPKFLSQFENALSAIKKVEEQPFHAKTASVGKTAQTIVEKKQDKE